MNLIVALFLVFMAAICRSISHKISRDFNNSIFVKGNPIFWNPAIIKYTRKNGILIFGYYIKFPTSDALHLANSFESILLLLIPFIYTPYHSGETFMYIGFILIYSITFLTFYKKFLTAKPLTDDDK